MNRYIIIFLISIIHLLFNESLFASGPTSIRSALNKLDAIKMKDSLYNDYKSYVLKNRFKEMDRKVVFLDDKEMKFELQFFGEKPKNGWSLYFSLHGGGGVEAFYNEKQWNRHKELYQLKQGILLTPRSPTNTWNMWHQKHIDIFFNRLIQNMIAFHDVNPNKIFLMGYSAGGDGVYQLAPRMADRFAAAAMMAGHPNETLPLGLRNIGFTIHMGENDSAYNRNGVAREWKTKLMQLRNKDSNGYEHLVKIHKNKGHWMGGLDTSGISWMANFIRNPIPKKIVWKQDDVTHNRFYWLKVVNPSERSLIIATIEDQTITIESTTVPEFIIMLNDDLIDMDKNVIVKYMGNTIYNGIVSRYGKIISDSIKEYGDPESVFYGQIDIELNISKI